MSEQYPGQVVDVPVIENMIESWKQFQGQTVNGEFELRDYLGGSTHSAVFLTEYDHQIASIHLISENAPDRDRQLASWQLATELSHVNLIRVFQVGLCQLANERVFYAVMELPDENLGQILTQRALTAEETTAMLAPALEALAYLHKRDIVHHSINPANIGALGDQLKLSVGTLARAGRANSHPGLYDPPETVSTPAADVWALGLTMVEVLTQRLPAWQRDAQGDPDITATLPQPLFDIARNSLRRDARRRLTVKQIAVRLNPSAVASAAETNETVGSAPAATESRPASASVSVSVPSGALATSTMRREEMPAPVSSPSRIEPPQIKPSYSQSASKISGAGRETAATPKQSSKSSYRTPIIVAVLLVAAFAGYRFFFSSHSTSPSTVVSTQEDARANTNGLPAPAETSATPAKPSATTPSSAAPNSTSPRSSVSGGTPMQPKAGSKSEASPISGNASGSVVHEALPEVPEKAFSTIHGRFHVLVRATSDASGNVSDASIDSPGPSQYFASLALKASRDWKFSPDAPGEWLIRFEFTSGGVTASAAPAQ
jgi:TonB family protein